MILGSTITRLRRAVEHRRFDARLARERDAHQFVADHLARHPELSEPGRLAPYEQSVFSQNGEDGVLSEIFRRIDTTNREFVEFGCGNGIENNTLFLLHRDWHGLWLDGDPALVGAIASSHGQFLESGRLRLAQAMVDAENIESLLDEHGVSFEPDLLSIDIDGNDYWVWEAIERISPRVVVIEYNAMWPPDTRWAQAYAPTTGWDGSSHHGASLASLVELGDKKGYRLVHCELAGVNAFFVRDDLVGEHFAPDASAATHYQPARYFLSSVASRPRALGAFESI